MAGDCHTVGAVWFGSADTRSSVLCTLANIQRAGVYRVRRRLVRRYGGFHRESGRRALVGRSL